MAVLDTSKRRINRVENDIETLRTTQANILNHLDSYLRTLNETRDIVDENRQRLGCIEDRQKQMDDRQKQMNERLKRMDDRQNSREEIGLEHSAAILDVHEILLSIANSLDLTIEKPGGQD